MTGVNGLDVTDVVLAGEAQRLARLLIEAGQPLWLRILPPADTRDIPRYIVDRDPPGDDDIFVHFYANSVHVLVDHASSALLHGAHVESAVKVVLDISRPERAGGARPVPTGQRVQPSSERTG